jgi:hypothetical protein
MTFHICLNPLDPLNLRSKDDDSANKVPTFYLFMNLNDERQDSKRVS